MAIFLIRHSNAIDFKNIFEVNGIRVSYKEDSHMLKSMGPLKRLIQLPQPGDIVKYTLVETDFQEEVVEQKVVDLKLHARNNPSKSLQVKLENGTKLDLTQIVDIDRKIGGDKFDRAKFQQYYVDYLSLVKKTGKL